MQAHLKGGEGPHPMVQIFGGGDGGPSPFLQILIRGGDGPHPLGPFGGEGPHPLLQIIGGGEGPKPFVQAGSGRSPHDWAEGEQRPKDEQAPVVAYVVGGYLNTAIFHLGADEPVCLYVATAKDGGGKDVWYVNRERLEFQSSDKTGGYWVYKALNNDLWYFPKHVDGPVVPLVYVRHRGGPLLLYGIGQQYPIVVPT
jgi:hypothetical protein